MEACRRRSSPAAARPRGGAHVARRSSRAHAAASLGPSVRATQGARVTRSSKARARSSHHGISGGVHARPCRPHLRRIWQNRTGVRRGQLARQHSVAGWYGGAGAACSGSGAACSGGRAEGATTTSRSTSRPRGGSATSATSSQGHDLRWRRPASSCATSTTAPFAPMAGSASGTTASASTNMLAHGAR
ncbi:unnamed protein product [Urochloa humidicola]